MNYSNVKKSNPIHMKQLLAFLTILLLASCGSSRKISKVDDKVKSVQPFSSADYRSDENYIRYVASEESADLSGAKALAYIQSESGIVLQANKEVEGMFTNYLNFAKGGIDKDVHKHIQYLFDGIIQIRLPRTMIIGEEAYKDPKTGKYTYYVATQISMDDLIKESERIAREDAALKEVVDEKDYRRFMEDKLREKRAAR